MRFRISRWHDARLMTARLDYEALVAGLPDAGGGVDAAVRIVLWNPAAEALLGRSARRVTGRTLKEVFPPDTSLVRHLSDTLATGESRSESEAIVESADGRAVHVSVMTAPLGGRRGGPAGGGGGAGRRPGRAARARGRRRWRWCATSRGSISSRPRCGGARP